MKLPLSVLITSISTSNWVSMRLKNDWRRNWVSNLFFIRYNQVHRERSSTLERKYLKLVIDSTAKGPQMSTWIESKILLMIELLVLNGNLLYFAYGQVLQSKVEEVVTFGNNLWIIWILFREWWPNLTCQRSKEKLFIVEFTTEVLLELAAEFILDGWKKYNPATCLATPIVFQECWSCMKQKSARKTKQHEFSISFLTNMRLKEKEGTYKALSRINDSDNFTVPRCVTGTQTPLGNFTEVFAIEMVVVKCERELTIWSLAALSTIQEFDFLKTWSVELTIPNRLNGVAIAFIDVGCCGEFWRNERSWLHCSWVKGNWGVGFEPLDASSKPFKDAETWLTEDVLGFAFYQYPGGYPCSL